jgi:hypothetical protein
MIEEAHFWVEGVQVRLLSPLNQIDVAHLRGSLIENNIIVSIRGSTGSRNPPLSPLA